MNDSLCVCCGRDSKLTRLLQHSLGGRTLTLLIATINPHLACAEDSRRTLALAAQAGHVLVSAPVNVTHPLDRRYVAALLRCVCIIYVSMMLVCNVCICV